MTFFALNSNLLLKLMDSHSYIKNQKRDIEKDHYLRSVGLSVIRIDGMEVKQDISKLVEELVQWIERNE